MVLAGCLMLLQACSASEIVSDVCLCECCQQDETGAFNCSTRVSTSAEVESCEECSASLCRVTFPQSVPRVVMSSLCGHNVLSATAGI